MSADAHGACRLLKLASCLHGLCEVRLPDRKRCRCSDPSIAAGL